MTRIWISLLALVFLPVVAVSCGGPAGPRTVDVTGVVTLDGQAVDGATVTFVPTDEGGRSAAGITDASGRFTLTTAGGGQGAVPGRYKVSIAKTRGGPAATGATSQEEAMARIKEQMESGGGMAAALSRPTQVEDLLPPKYKDFNTSGLEATVESGKTNDFTFALSSK